MKHPKRLGRYISASTAGETFKAFIPPPLPPDPPLQLRERDYDLMERANRAVGRLDGMTSLLPDASLFIYFYVRKEALLSSQIEGTQSSFADLILFETKEAPGVALADVQEVSNYVAAMNHGLKRLREGFPLSLRLLREMHGVLLSKGRGAGKFPGEFRRTHEHNPKTPLLHRPVLTTDPQGESDSGDALVPSAPARKAQQSQIDPWTSVYGVARSGASSFTLK